MEKVEDLAEVMDTLSATTVDNKDTMHKTIPTIPILVTIASLAILSLKNALFYKLRCRKKDHRWKIRIAS